MVRPVTDDDTGFKVLHEPELAEPESNDIVDIIAVHGIGAHPDDTWCKLREVGLDATDPKSYVNWLSNVDRDHKAKVKNPLAFDVKQYLPAPDHVCALLEWIVTKAELFWKP
ncbi:hypothetical protein KCV03_g9672, partial [Aureobasidium melanogenum]